MHLHPTDRPATQFVPLIRLLAQHDVRWVLCGSHVLALHGAEIVANDLDVVPDLATGNLIRIAVCLDALEAVPAYFGGAAGPDDTYEACLAWRSDPPTPENLDHLFVTPLGMLDIVIRNADPYESFLAGASPMSADGAPFLACDPRRVLKALEGRSRQKDRDRRSIYEAMRRDLGMPELDG